MNLYLRFLYFLVVGLFRRKSTPLLGEVHTRFRVLPNDLDLNLHVNNGRFLTIMDLGRFDLIGKAGLFPIIVKRKWFPILGAAQIEFFRPLKLWQAYTIVTRIECWDEKWFVISQRFVSTQGKTLAQAYVRGLFRGPQGNVPVSDFFRALGEDEVPRTDVPEAARQLLLQASAPRLGSTPESR